jgi:hypothetical protein
MYQFTATIRQGTDIMTYGLIANAEQQTGFAFVIWPAGGADQTDALALFAKDHPAAGPVLVLSAPPSAVRLGAGRSRRIARKAA